MLHKGGARALANRQGLTVDPFMVGSGHGRGSQNGGTPGVTIQRSIFSLLTSGADMSP